MLTLARLPRGALFALTGGLVATGALLAFGGRGGWGTLLGVPLRNLGTGVAVLWMAATAHRLGTRRGFDNRFTLVVATGYLVLSLLYGGVEAWLGLLSWPRPAALAALFGAGKAAAGFWVASYVMLTYKAAAALEGAEGARVLPAARKLLNWLGFALFPVGVWSLQPRVRAALRAPYRPERRLEDHLVP